MKTIFQSYPENPLKKYTRKKHPKKHPKKHQYLKSQEKTPIQKTPIFGNLQKKHPKKNTNSEILPKKHPNQETPIFENRGKTPKKKHPKKHLPDYHCPPILSVRFFI